MSKLKKKASGVRIIASVVIWLSIGIIFALEIPQFLHSRQLALRNACLNHLVQIDGAKQQWKLEHQKTGADIPTWEDIKPYITGNQELKCPSGGIYSMGRGDEQPTCSLGTNATLVHVLP